ncbi:MAG: bifunctional 4-hydroxy-2-oxoglutarate aldolase/2-dehydro-3-deoxy-phosphogluconate aldolase [Cyanobium sp.]
MIASLRRQPLLMVLRPLQPLAAVPLLARLQSLGVRHVELAWQSSRGWSGQVRELISQFPQLALGAASITQRVALDAAIDAGCGYGMSPILDPELLSVARSAGFTLVPGVMSPSEVHGARQCGSAVVKLFPAAPLGPGYWRRLLDPLGPPLPFCIAAGGLAPADVTSWLAAGVDAVALGSALLRAPGSQRSAPALGVDGLDDGFDPAPLQELLAGLKV